MADLDELLAEYFDDTAPRCCGKCGRFLADAEWNTPIYNTGYKIVITMRFDALCPVCDAEKVAARARAARTDLKEFVRRLHD
jgi:hypothetical protein